MSPVGSGEISLRHDALGVGNWFVEVDHDVLLPKSGQAVWGFIYENLSNRTLTPRFRAALLGHSTQVTIQPVGPVAPRVRMRHTASFTIPPGLDYHQTMELEVVVYGDT